MAEPMGKRVPSERKLKASNENLQKAHAAKKAKGKQYVKSERRPPTGPTGRLIITMTAGAEVSHWMPKEGEEWTCPFCGVQFERSDAGWGMALAS